jgi:hypothetical protein
MKNLNETVGLSVAKDYMKDRLEYEQSWQMIKQVNKEKPNKFYCAVCFSLVSLGHLLVAFGCRLERFDLVMRESKAQ